MSTGTADPGNTLRRGHFCWVDGVNPFGRDYIAGGESSSIGLSRTGGVVFTNLVSTGASARGTGFDVPATAHFSGTPALAEGTSNFQLLHGDACMAARKSNFSNGASITCP